MTALTAGLMAAQVQGYMDACTGGDAAEIARYLTEDAVHFFPPDMYDGPWRGGRLIADRWAVAVAQRRSAWTVDALAVDESRQVAVCEWSHFKRAAGVLLRGTEWYAFAADARISEIRAYYASPQAVDLTRLELGGFDYEGRGYPLELP
jgi:hypothetical protein